jgi:elongation factor P
MKANEVRRGTVLMYNGIPHRVMEFTHHTPGNLRAKVQTKLRNLFSGNQTEVRFSSTEDITEADVVTRRATYLYSDSDGHHFMTSESFEQFSLTDEILGDDKYFIQEQMEVDVTLFEGNPISIKTPQTVVLTIVETEPEIKASTASSSPKPAKTDTGLTLNVPPFVKEGDRIVVNTEERTYISRASE